MPIAQHLRLDPRVGDGDAAQPPRIPRQGVKQHAIVVTVRITLHDETVGEAEMVEQRNKPLDRRVGRRIAAPRRVGEFVRRSENVEMRVPGAGRRRDARPLRPRYRAGNARRLEGSRHQPNLMLVSFTTRLQSCIWPATKAPNSAGVFCCDWTLSSANRAVTFGDRIAALRSAFSFCTMAAGAPCGTNTPFHSKASNPGSVSEIGGTSGRLASRPLPVWAMAFNFLYLRKPTTEEPLAKKNFT